MRCHRDRIESIVLGRAPGTRRIAHRETAEKLASFVGGFIRRTADGASRPSAGDGAALVCQSPRRSGRGRILRRRISSMLCSALRRLNTHAYTARNTVGSLATMLTRVSGGYSFQLGPSAGSTAASRPLCTQGRLALLQTVGSGYLRVGTRGT